MIRLSGRSFPRSFQHSFKSKRFSSFSSFPIQQFPKTLLSIASVSQPSSSSSSSSSKRTTPFLLYAAGSLTLLLSCYYKKQSSSSSCESSKTFPIYRQSEVEKHNQLKDGQRLWVTFKDGIYDVTDFISSHPGGKDRILQAGGQDLKDFWLQKEFRHHLRSPLANEILEELRIGTLHSDDVNWEIVQEINSSQSYHPIGGGERGRGDPLQFPNDKIYDCLIIGAGISGLKTAHTLINSYHIPHENILLLEAQDYVGGRVKQITEFIPGIKIDVGAEFLHGDHTELTKFAKETQQPLRKIFCWAHGDGGPLSSPVDNGYGLYFIENEKGECRLLRYDAKDSDFQQTNEILHHLSQLNPKDYSDFHSLEDYLRGQGLSSEMLEMANAGFSNTLCTSSKMLSLKRCIQWENLWHGSDSAGHGDGDGEVKEEGKGQGQEEEEEEEEHDFTFVNSFGCLVDYLKQDLQIELNAPVSHIDYTLPSPLPSLSSGKISSQRSHLPELIKLTTVDGIPYYAKSIVITSSPHVMKSSFPSSSSSSSSSPSSSSSESPLMTFEPPLSHEIQEALETTQMNSIVKVILKFSKLPWPHDLHGMIMANTNPKTNPHFVLPEMWFRHVDEETKEKGEEGKGKEEENDDEKAVCYVVGFMTTEYAKKILKMSNSDAINCILQQMDTVFSHLEPQHMSAAAGATGAADSSSSLSNPQVLPKPSGVFLGGTFWHWTPEHHPYIGGGYSSPVAGKATTLCDHLSKPYGEYQNIFFAGEATSLPGATAHAALESGVRAAQQVANHLNKK